LALETCAAFDWGCARWRYDLKGERIGDEFRRQLVRRLHSSVFGTMPASLRYDEIQMRADYADWSVKALYYVGGVASTIIGSFISSKVRVYHEAKNSHRDELKHNVLEPLRESLLSYYSDPRFDVRYQVLQHNPQALSGEFPTIYGPAVALERVGEPPKVDEALFEDARRHHYKSLMASWAAFDHEWNEEARRHLEIIEAIGKEMLPASTLPAFPVPASFTSPYIMHWYLGNFVYSRLVLDTVARLEIQSQVDGHIITDGQVTAAKGSEAAMKNVIQWVDGLMSARRDQAKGLRAGLENLEKKRATLSRQLSLAIAEQKLRHRCSLVRFF